MIEFRNTLILRRDVWFDEEWQGEGADIIVVYHGPKPMNGAESQEVSSLELDLRLDENSIFAGFTSTARNLVSRGIREKLSSEVWFAPGRTEIDDFFSFQRQFSQERSMHFQAPLWMYEYANHNALALTLARSPSGQPLVWHSYFRDPKCARLLHSISLSGGGDPEQRKLIGWANRYLHWMDITHLRAVGIKTYDFGGWYSGVDDEKLLSINEFKQQFGGKRTTAYHSMMPVSLKGRLYLAARRTLGKPNFLHFV